MAEPTAWLVDDALPGEKTDWWLCLDCEHRGVTNYVATEHQDGVKKGHRRRAYCRVCLVAPDAPLLPAGPSDWRCDHVEPPLAWP